MSAILVDSNVLLDTLTEDADWFRWSSKALAEAAENATLVINPIIYAEVSIRFERIEDLDLVACVVRARRGEEQTAVAAVLPFAADVLRNAPFQMQLVVPE